MKTLGQLALILGLAYLGHLLAAGLSAPLPAGVIGILLLLGCLRMKWIAREWIDDAARFLTANMAFFFLPPAVEIIDNMGAVRPVLFRLLLVCAAGTVCAFFATYIAVRLLRKTTGNKEAGQ